MSYRAWRHRQRLRQWRWVLARLPAAERLLAALSLKVWQ
jgi:hypothetical protein